LGSVMNTESHQSSENRHQDSSPAQEPQRTGVFGWGEPVGLVPPWSVPPGLIVPHPRAPQTDALAGDEPSENPVQDAHDGNPAHQALSNQDPTHEASAAQRPPAEAPGEAPAAEDDAWPGIAPPAGWFLSPAAPPPQQRPPPQAQTGPPPPARPPMPGAPGACPRRVGSLTDPGPPRYPRPPPAPPARPARPRRERVGLAAPDSSPAVRASRLGGPWPVCLRGRNRSAYGVRQEFSGSSG